jgi:hypothetical protein
MVAMAPSGHLLAMQLALDPGQGQVMHLLGQTTHSSSKGLELEQMQG